MRTLLTALILTVAAAPAYAADLGTYRPGKTYHTTSAPEAGVCEAQCSGDAQCRAWNYVKPAPGAPAICELQSEAGPGVSSAISISGVNTGSYTLRPDVSAGATNTTRVGISSPAVRRPQVTQSRSGRRVVREAQPMARPAQPTAYRAQPSKMGLSLEQQRAMIRASQDGQPQVGPNTQPHGQPVSQARRAPMAQQPRAQQFRPMLDAQGVRPQQRPQQPQQQMRAPAAGQAVPQPRMQQPRMQQPRMQQPRQQHATRGSARRRNQANRAQTRPAAAPQPRTQSMGQGRPPIGQPIAPPANYRAQAPAPAVPPSAAMPRASATNPVSFKNAQASLYGSLHDDVHVPASNQPVPADANAPIPTSASRPVAPVQSEQLAGPRSR